MSHAQKSSEATIGDINKSDILVHLYKTPMKSKRWYLRLFAYVVDISLTNAWILYCRDCKALSENGMSQKNFRAEVCLSAATKKPNHRSPPEEVWYLSKHQQQVRCQSGPPSSNSGAPQPHFGSINAVRLHFGPSASVREMPDLQVLQ